MTGPVHPDQPTTTDPDETQAPDPTASEQPQPDQPEPPQPEAAQPEADQPEPPQPEADQPQPDQPEAAQPQPDQPEADQPEADQPEPEADQPEADQPEAAQPQPDQAEADQPEADQPEPEADQPQPDQPEADQPEADQPEPEAAQPQPDQAEAPQPEAERPQADQAKGEQPKAEQPEGEQAKAEKPKAEQKQPKPKKKPKPQGPSVGEVVATIGASSERALAYVAKPDPKLSRLPRKVRETLIADLPAVTAGALLGPAALARHLVASAAAGRYRDLFALWDLFRSFPEECKPVLAERQEALARAQAKLAAAVRIGLRGRTHRLVEDLGRAEGLIWQWLRELLVEALPAVGARPAVAVALLRREPDLDVPVPAQPTPRWLAEAVVARGDEPLPQAFEEALAANVHRMPATVETLRFAARHYPDRVPALLDRVDLDAPDVEAFLAWARDHDAAERLYTRIRDRVSAAAARDRTTGLELWYRWTQRGVHVPLPETLQTDSLDGYDLSRPETAAFAAHLLGQGVELDLQAELEQIATRNRQLAEKAYEAMVCANLDVTLPAVLEGNPIVKAGTRCPNCRAWTWVRPGHEQRCPRPPAPPEERQPDPFELAAAEVARAQQS